MTEMEEIKTMLVDMNKKLDKVIFQNKIALNTKYGLPIKQEIEESCCKKFREVKYVAIKEFAEKLKKKLFEFFQDNEGLDEKISVVTLYVDIIGVDAEDGTIISLGLIDRLLKEYEEWKILD